MSENMRSGGIHGQTNHAFILIRQYVAQGVKIDSYMEKDIVVLVRDLLPFLSDNDLKAIREKINLNLE